MVHLMVLLKVHARQNLPVGLARFAGGRDAVEVIVADNASTDDTAAIAAARGCRVALWPGAAIALGIEREHYVDSNGTLGEHYPDKARSDKCQRDHHRQSNRVVILVM